MSKRLTLEGMQAIAKSRNGGCLSDRYINCKTKLRWRCSEGHEWVARPSDIKRGHWCPACARKRVEDAQRLTIEEMCSIAESRGGVCLSKRYINCKTKLRWRCEDGHEWEAIPQSVKRGTWCPYYISSQGTKD